MRTVPVFCFLLCIALSCKAGVFDVIKSFPSTARIAKAQDIYNNQVKQKDSVFSIHAIEELLAMSRQINDPSLECFSISLLADQYARIRGANDYSVLMHHKAIDLAEKYQLTLMTGICNYRLGRYYYSFKQYPVAFEYLLRADNFFYDLGYKEVPDIDEILFFVGSIYYETGDYDKAEHFLQKIQQLPAVNAYISKQSLNTIALSYRQRNDTAQTLLYFQKTLNESIAQRDSTWIGICYTNIGSLYFSLKQYEKAYRMLVQGDRLSFLNHQWGDAHADLLLLAMIDMKQNRTMLAKQRIDSAISLHAYYYSIHGRKNLDDALALYYEQTGQLEKALAVQHELILIKDSIAVNKDQQTYKKIQSRIETEKHLNDIDTLETRVRASTLKRNAVIVVLILVVAVLLLLYNRYRLKAKNNAEQLSNASIQLRNFTENSRQKNELIEQFAAELERLKANLPGHAVHEERVHNFEKLVQSTILTDAEWNDFRLLFDKVYKGFFERLQKKLPELSLNDTRLMSLLKLGLTDNDIANMSGRNTETIAQAKQRLREKIHPSKDGLSLEDLVQAI